MSVSEHYNASAENYHRQYQEETLKDLTQDYPANYFRLQLLLQSFIKNNVKTAIEVGVGEGTPLATLASAGIDVSGFDISTEMVKRAKASVDAIGQDPARIILADVEDPLSYAKLLEDGEFDALMAMGVMPHVKNDDQSLLNMRSMVKPGGLVFIEFRNKLFSMFTFNRYTYEFIMDDLLEGVSDELKNTVGNFLKPKLEMINRLLAFTMMRTNPRRVMTLFWLSFTIRFQWLPNLRDLVLVTSNCCGTTFIPQCLCLTMSTHCYFARKLFGLKVTLRDGAACFCALHLLYKRVEPIS